MRKRLKRNEEAPEDPSNKGGPSSESLRKLNDITKDIDRIDFWMDELPSKLRQKILYATKKIGGAFLDPSIIVNLIEFACSGYTKKEIRHSLPLSAIDAVRNVLIAKKFGDLIVDKINVIHVNRTTTIMATIEDLYPNLKKYHYNIKGYFPVQYFAPFYMGLLGKSYWTKTPINVYVRQVSKEVTIRVVDTNVLFEEDAGIGQLIAIDKRGERVLFSDDVREIFYYAIFELDFDGKVYRCIAAYSTKMGERCAMDSMMVQIDMSYGALAGTQDTLGKIKFRGEFCGKPRSMTLDRLINCALLHHFLNDYSKEIDGPMEEDDGEKCPLVPCNYGFMTNVLGETGDIGNKYTTFMVNSMAVVKYDGDPSLTTKDCSMVIDGVRYIFEHGGHRGYAFVGKPGSGKTTMMKRIVQEFSDKANFIILGKDNLGEMNPYLVSSLCYDLGNTIIIIDDIDSIDFEEKNGNVDVLIRLFSDLNTQPCNYVFICTANNAMAINKCLIGRADRIDEVVKFEGVTAEEAKKFFADKFPDQEFDQECGQSFQKIQDEGMTYSDLSNLTQLVTIYFNGKVTPDAMSFAIKRVIDTKTLANSENTV